MLKLFIVENQEHGKHHLKRLILNAGHGKSVIPANWKDPSYFSNTLGFNP